MDDSKEDSQPVKIKDMLMEASNIHDKPNIMTYVNVACNRR